MLVSVLGDSYKYNAAPYERSNRGYLNPAMLGGAGDSMTDAQMNSATNAQLDAIIADKTNLQATRDLALAIKNSRTGSNLDLWKRITDIALSTGERVSGIINRLKGQADATGDTKTSSDLSTLLAEIEKNKFNVNEALPWLIGGAVALVLMMTLMTRRR